MVILGYEDSLRDIAGDAVSAEGAQVFHLDEAFAGVNPESIRFVNDTHWNRFGHLRIAQHLTGPVAELLRSRTQARSEKRVLAAQ